MVQRLHALVAVLLSVGLLLAACTAGTPTQPQPVTVPKPTEEPQPKPPLEPEVQPGPVAEPEPDPAPKIKPEPEQPGSITVGSLLERFVRENPSATVLHSVEADLNMNGTKELVVAYQPSGSRGAVVGILPADSGLVEVDSINIARAVQSLTIFDHGETVHLIVIIGLGHNYVTTVYTFDGQNVGTFWQVEADESVRVEGKELVIKRRLYKDQGYEVETAIVTWDPITKSYVARKG